MSTIVRETIQRNTEADQSRLTFYFDPVCPWAWRASQWIREVQRLQPLDVQWKFFSLAAANDLDPALYLPLRVLALARRESGNEAVGKLYEAIGTIVHEENDDNRRGGALDEATRDAVIERGYAPAIIRDALDDLSTLEDVRASTQEAKERYGAYGVPWLILGDHDFGFNGPVIDQVPRGETALALWQHLSFLLAQPYFYEVKRARRQRTAARQSSPAGARGAERR